MPTAQQAAQLFLSTPSARRATVHVVSVLSSLAYFYPRPPRGGRRLAGDALRVLGIFLSTPSARRATQAGRNGRNRGGFLSTPSARRATGHRACVAAGTRDFYPRPPRGGRHPDRRTHTRPCYFYPRPPRGGRLRCRATSDSSARFLSTPSARRATSLFQLAQLFLDISIHALREEGDALDSGAVPMTKDFYPRPPRGGRLALRLTVFVVVTFLSTPSARRATALTWVLYPPDGISIHALREEGDRPGNRPAEGRRNFYPRPPRGGRRRA